jgi:hypothetical protein
MKLKYRAQNWVSSWIDLISATIAIATLGRIYVAWPMQIRAWFTLRNIKDKKMITSPYKKGKSSFG